jgi:hypothetical protein
MSLVYADNLLPSATGYDLGSASQQWDVYSQNIICSGTGSFTGTLSIVKLEDVRFADQFPGLTVTNKIDAALADVAACLVVVPTSMGAGNESSIPANSAVLDLRTPGALAIRNFTGTVLQLVGDEILGQALGSLTAGIATTGQVRLANVDAIKIRNSGNTTDLNLASMSGNILALGGAAGCSMSGALAIAGALSGVTSISASGVITSTLAIGTAPLSITSTTVVPNLNVAMLNGVAVTGVPAALDVLTATSATAASWAAQAAPTSAVILDKQDVLGALTGDSTDKTMYTYSMPSGTLAASKGIRVTMYLRHSTGANSVTYKVSFGATAVTVAAVTANTNSMEIHSMVFNNTASTTAQWMATSVVGVGATGDARIGAPAENTNSGSPIVVKATFNVANTDQVTPQGWLVELIT